MLLPRFILLSSLALGGGCFYLADLNERPRPRIQEKSSGPYTLASEAVFSATGSEDDDGTTGLEVFWQALNCDVDGFACVAQGPAVRVNNTASEFVVTPAQKGTLRIDLTLVDRSGVAEKVSSTYPVLNAEPELFVELDARFPDPGDLGGHVLGLPVYIATAASDSDGDDIVLSWIVTPPPGSVPENVVFRPVEGDQGVYELVGDVAGVWEVTVRADDQDGGVAMATKQVVFAPDGPPCLGAVTPASRPGDAVILTSVPKAFGVRTVIDALDPWPALANPHPLIGTTTFSWSIARAVGQPFEALTGEQRAELVVDPAQHAPGDHISLRVEITDRVAAHTVDCPAGEPGCSAAANECTQRMTWEIDFR